MITRRSFLKGAAAGGAAWALGGCRNKYAKAIVVYNWPYYMSPPVLFEFEKKYGIKVAHYVYASGNDHELPTTLAATDQVDVVVPGQDILEELIRRNLLLPLDHGRIRNFRNVLSGYRGKYFDPENTYSVPYLWGTTGLGINLVRVEDLKPTWDQLWRPSVAGRISLLDTPSEVLAAILKMMGESANGADWPKIMKAGKFLLDHRNQKPAFLDSSLGPLSSGKIWVAHSHSGDALQARKVERTITYLLPEEGALQWIDSLCIPAKAQHPVEAHLFINFLLDGEIGGMLSNELWYANPNGASFKYTDMRVLRDPAVYPRKDILDKCELKRTDPKSVERFLDVWKEFRLSQK